MTPRVEVLFIRPWVGRKPGDRIRVQPNVARLWVRMRVAEIVPVVVDAPVAVLTKRAAGRQRKATVLSP